MERPLPKDILESEELITLKKAAERGHGEGDSRHGEGGESGHNEGDSD